MEMARTMLSPRCWATSRVSVLAISSNVTSACSALNSSGTEPRGNSTSTTGPVTRTTRPVASCLRGSIGLFGGSSHLFFASSSGYRGVGQRVGAADDLADFLGDLGLPRAVGLSVRALMRSSALSVAAFIARRRDADSDAADSSSAA